MVDDLFWIKFEGEELTWEEVNLRSKWKIENAVECVVLMSQVEK